MAATNEGLRIALAPIVQEDVQIVLADEAIAELNSLTSEPSSLMDLSGITSLSTGTEFSRAAYAA